MKNSKKGFALIELIVVVAVIAILTLIATPWINTWTKDADLLKIKSDVKVAEQITEEYLLENSKLPDSLPIIGEEIVNNKINQGTLCGKGGIVTEIPQGPYFDLDGWDILNKGNINTDNNIISNNNGDTYIIIKTKSTSSDSTDNPIEDSKGIELEDLKLQWTKLYYDDFGYTQHGSETQIDIYDNGNAQIAVYYAETPYMSYFNHDAKEWTVVNVPWWEHGKPDILYADDGVFIAEIEGLSNVIASFDGITWHNAGYNAGAQNGMKDAAYDMDIGVGITSWWYYKTPIYYSFDPLEERTAWTMTGEDGVSVPVFEYLTTHRNRFIGIEGGGKEIYTTMSTAPVNWIKSRSDDGTTFMDLQSINDRLFVLSYTNQNIDGDWVFNTKLSLLSDDAQMLHDTSLSYSGDLMSNEVPSPANVVYMDEWVKYLSFKEGNVCMSSDASMWECQEQVNFNTAKNGEIFHGAMYVSGDGFYVKSSGGYVYYAPYKIIEK